MNDSNVVRFFVVVKDGVVVGSRSTLRQYDYAVLHVGAAGAFATFHGSHERACVARTFFGGGGQVVETIETSRRYQVGEAFVVESANDDDVDEAAERGADILAGPWRNS